MMKIKFIFDLDGTLTKEESLPRIAKYFHIEQDIEALTEATIQGNVPFEESFQQRVHLLCHLPVEEVQEILAAMPVYDSIRAFIRQHQAMCAIATSNLYCWIEKLAAGFGCKVHASEAKLEQGQVTGVKTILSKLEVVQQYQQEGCYVIFIGDGNNDVEALEQADIGIAVSITHPAAPKAVKAAAHHATTEAELNTLLKKRTFTCSFSL